MNRDFLSNFEKKQKPPETADDLQPEVDISEADYKVGEFCRCLFLAWPDGQQYFLDYSRLDSGAINVEHTEVQLSFGRETIELKGERLEPLYKSIALHLKKTIYCEDARYNDLDTETPVVNEITITAAT